MTLPYGSVLAKYGLGTKLVFPVVASHLSPQFPSLLATELTSPRMLTGPVFHLSAAEDLVGAADRHIPGCMAAATSLPGVQSPGVWGIHLYEWSGRGLQRDSHPPAPASGSSRVERKTVSHDSLSRRP
ncbi:hypothetical protein ACRRTK_007982 [Alexandromys fortis]